MESLYRPLSAELNEIRLLELLPPTEDTNIPCCKIWYHRLGEQHDYFALSYVWGTTEDRGTIQVNGQNTLVTKNLFHALACLTSQVMADGGGKSLFVWVDALCINQDDLAEKAQQIPLMGTIFGSAQTVLAYLGAGSESTAQAIEMLEGMQPHLQSHLTKKIIALDWMEGFPLLWQSDQGKGEIGTFWDGLIELMTAPYWSRAWILQEMALAKGIILFTGGSEKHTVTLEFNTLLLWHAFVNELREQRGDPLPNNIPTLLWSTASHMYASAAYSIQIVIGFLLDLSEPVEHGASRRLTKMTDLKEFYKICKKFCATDPRDLIYAYLNLMDLDVEVDYSQNMTVAKLFTQFATRCIEDSECGQLLTMSGFGWNETNAFDCPSWVPDWQYLSSSAFAAVLGGSYEAHPHNILNGDRKYNAARGMPPGTAPVVINENTLHVQGCIIETVTTPLCLVDGVPHTTENAEICEALFQFCVRFDGSSASEMPALQIVFRTILQDVYHIEGDASRLYGDNAMRTFKAVAAFLACIVDPYRDNVHQLAERLQCLGWHKDTESYKDFILRVFFAGSEDAMAPAILDAVMNGMIMIPNQIGSNALDVFRMGREEMFKLQESQRYFPTAGPEVRSAMLLLINDNLSNNRLLKLSNGGLAMVPPGTREGDLLCVLADCHYPVILRETEDNFVHVSPCYAFGLMDGEAANLVRDGKKDMQDFNIV